jgi:hypothetical protein
MQRRSHLTLQHQSAKVLLKHPELRMCTCAATMDSIINLPELFEEVLHQLPFLDLVIATGVNHTFRNFISSSPKLQRKLFQLPSLPPRSEEEQKHFSKQGIFGRGLKQDICLNFGTGEKPPTVTLCPFLLEPDCEPNTPTAHLTTRAAEANFWPNMYLTDPPCAHAQIFFSYIGIYGIYGEKQLTVEAYRAVYRWDGVTLMTIEEALSQAGAVTIRERKGKRMISVRTIHGTTLSAEVEGHQKLYRCELSMDVRATTISLHGIPVRSEEAPFVMMPMKGLQGVPATWGGARKIRFED